MDSIKSSAEISTLFESGTRINTPFLTLIVSKQHDRYQGANGRVAFIAGKRLGNAVWRNRAKRRMRALCHDLGGGWQNLDVIFLAKRRVTDVPYEKMLRGVREALKKSEDIRHEEKDSACH